MTDKEIIKEYLRVKSISKNSFYTRTKLSIGYLDSGKSLTLPYLKIIINEFPDLAEPLGINELISNYPNIKADEVPINNLVGEGDVLYFTKSSFAKLRCTDLSEAQSKLLSEIEQEYDQLVKAGIVKQNKIVSLYERIDEAMKLI